jgi:hypothetical protein
MYASEESIQDYKNKWHNHMFRRGSSRRAQNVKNTNQTGEEMLNDGEDDGRTVSEMERANKAGLERSEDDGGDFFCSASCRTFSATYLTKMECTYFRFFFFTSLALM